MESKIKRGGVLLVVQLSLLSWAAAQDSLSYPVLTRKDNKEIWFDQQVGLENSGLVNGVEYSFPFKGATTHPFFYFADATKGWVVYNNNRYEEVQLLYDIFSEVLVLKYLRSDGLLSLVQLENDRIDSFSIYHHRFRKYQVRDVKARLAPGFYDILFEDATFELVAKRTKETHIESASRVDFEVADRFYFVEKDRWTKLSTKSSFYSVLTDKADMKKLSVFIKSNGIKLRKKKDEDLIKIASFYHSIRQPGKE